MLCVLDIIGCLGVLEEIAKIHFKVNQCIHLDKC